MWLVESAKRGSRMKDQYKVNGIDVFIKDRMTQGVDPEFVFNYISARVPFFLTSANLLVSL